MANWFVNGRRAIFENLAEICDKIDDDLNAEQETIQKELESLRSQVVEADRLKQENRSLRAQLGQLQRTRHQPQTPQNPRRQLGGQHALDSSKRLGRHKQDTSLPTPQSANQPLRSDSPLVFPTSDEDVDWKREAAKNAAKYYRIRTELDTAREALVRRREEIDSWELYAERLQKKVETLESRSGEQDQPSEVSLPSKKKPKLGVTGTSGVVQGAVEQEKPDGNPVRGSSAGAGVRASTPRLPPAVRTPSSLPYPTGGIAVYEDCPTQSDSTQETREAPEMTLPELPHEDSLLGEPRIKSEPSSDIPVVVSERVVRKRKRVEPGDQQPSPTRVKQENPESDPIVTADLCDFSPASSVDLDESGTRLDTPRKDKQMEAIRSGVLHFQEPSVGVPPSARRKLEQTPNTSRVLQPLSANVRTPRPRRPFKKGVQHAISELAEDGGAYGASSDRQLLHPRTEPTPGHLAGLLNRPAVEAESPLVRQRERLDRAQPNSETPWIRPPQPRELPFDKQVRDKSKVHEDKTRRENTASPVCGLARQGSRSSTPTARPKLPANLRLEDFRINPKFNNGYDYAYTEVVRNKDERACISGCVDMECCGKHFRAMALAERGVGPRTPTQITEDRRLLENYLGDEAYRLFSMTKEEKDEVWLEAKTRELADRIGKHRHRFGRMRSPPGFWRTDFPTTQEEEEDKEAAARREKEQVQERYREAMRPGGKWVLKD